MSGRSVHVPVMLREVLHYLQLNEGLTVLDGTVGAGGHSFRIVEQIGESGHLFGFDRDPMMLKHAARRLPQSNVTLIQSSYANAKEFLNKTNVTQVDRVLLDLGLSSDQLADRERGFGFDAGGPLDMRFDTTDGPGAADFLRTAAAQEIENALNDFGEEPFARQIASEICKRRATHPIENTEDLENVIRTAVPRSAFSGSKNPATRTFQSLRIVVNNELEHVHRMMTAVLPEILKPNGIAVVITFHSLEDRIVKNAFKGQRQWTALTKKPTEATPAEIRLNPRSRSAKLRAARRKTP